MHYSGLNVFISIANKNFSDKSFYVQFLNELLFRWFCENISCYYCPFINEDLKSEFIYHQLRDPLLLKVGTAFIGEYVYRCSVRYSALLRNDLNWGDSWKRLTNKIQQKCLGLKHSGALMPEHIRANAFYLVLLLKIWASETACVCFEITVTAWAEELVEAPLCFYPYSNLT